MLLKPDTVLDVIFVYYLSVNVVLVAILIICTFSVLLEYFTHFDGERYFSTRLVNVVLLCGFARLLFQK